MTSIRRVPEDHPTKKEPEFPLTGTAAEDALDDMDDVGIEGFDDDEDLDDEDLAPPQAPRVVAVPVVEPAKRQVKKPPPRPQPRQAGPNSAVLQKAARAAEELEEFLAGLSFGEDQHRIVVNRLEPTHDPKTGENISGNLKTYYMPVGVEELQKAFGGGLYELIIMGPDPMSGRKLAIRKRDKVRIAGKPRLASDIEETKEKPDERADLFIKALESKEREVERLAKEARDAQRLLLETALKPKDDGAVMATVISLIKEQQSKSENSAAALIQAMREERRADEERRREEREREERRRSEEREAERFRREAEERRYREEVAERQRQHEKELAMLEARSKHESAEGGKLTEVMLKFMETSRKEEQERARFEKQRQDELAKMQFEVMQTSSKQAADMAIEASRFQMTLMSEALREAKSAKKGGLAETAQELVAFKQVMRDLNGDDDGPEESTAEKILNRVEAFVPSLATAAASIMASRQPQTAQAPVPQQVSRMALVDQGPALPPHQAPPQPQQAPPPRNGFVELPQQPLQAQQQGLVDDPFETEEQDVAKAAAAANDFTEYHFPTKGADMTEVATCIVKNLDLAIAQGKNAEDIAEEVLPHFVKEFGMVVFMLRKASADELVKFVEERVPPTWAISSPNGEKILRELHEIINEA